MIAVLDEPAWRLRAEEHAERVAPWIEPHLERRRRGARHPVEDFLFDYYAWRPGQLLRWHPGAGVHLMGNVSDWGRVSGYVVEDGHAYADAASVEEGLVSRTLVLLEATAARQPVLGCFGRHEWAMVYRLKPEEVRHSSWPLRLPPDEIADVVETGGLRCTHFDAFRFFTDEARPLNAHRPTRATQIALEQPGCLHATMDLYKWAFRCYPVVSAELTADCFALARSAREVDMRAAPYDLRDLGYEPIRIETAEGRTEYLREQRQLMASAAALRTRLIDALRLSLSERESPEQCSAGARDSLPTPR